MATETIDVKSTEALADVLMRFKEYRTVTDVGASMFSGYGTIIKVKVDHDMKIIELVGD